jgi:hypothetical protein
VERGDILTNYSGRDRESQRSLAGSLTRLRFSKAFVAYSAPGGSPRREPVAQVLDVTGLTS